MCSRPVPKKRGRRLASQIRIWGNQPLLGHLPERFLSRRLNGASQRIMVSHGSSPVAGGRHVAADAEAIHLAPTGKNKSPFSVTLP